MLGRGLTQYDKTLRNEEKKLADYDALFDSPSIANDYLKLDCDSCFAEKLKPC